MQNNTVANETNAVNNAPAPVPPANVPAPSATPAPPAPQKPEHEPNKASGIRWVAVFVIGYIGTQFLNLIPIAVRILFFNNVPEEFNWLPATLVTFVTFALGFLLVWLMLRVIIKTSLRDFCFGSGNKFNIKHAGIFALALVIGILITTLSNISEGKIELNPLGFLPVFVNVVICLMFIWMQTSYEEFLCRGVFMRWACGDKITITVKSVLFGVISSALFMCGHFLNPEMAAQTDTISTIAMALSYFSSGFFMYFMGLLYGNLLPGLAVHWANNAFLSIFLTQDGTVLNTASIFVDHTPVSNEGVLSLISTIAIYILPLIYGIYLYRKKRKEGTDIPA